MEETFGDYLIRRYHELAMTYPGRFKSLTEFAQWIDPSIKQSTFSTWVNNSKTPAGKNVDLLAAKLGVEVYDRLGLARKMPKDKKLNMIAAIWDKLPPDLQDEWYRKALEIKDDQERDRGRFRRAE